LEAWVKFIEGKKESHPRLAAAMDLEVAQPALLEDCHITCFTANPQQKEWMETNVKPELATFLCTELQNDSITLELIVIPLEQQKNKPYTNEQKFAYLKTNYPAVEQLTQALDLDT
jgi:hypothetical protein